MRNSSLVCALLLVGLFSFPSSTDGRPKPKKRPAPDLSIGVDATGGKVVLTWDKGGTLKRASIADGQFKKVPKRPGQSSGRLVTEPTGAGSVFVLDKGAPSGVHSVNIVGYVNLTLPPGLSLLANPLYYTTNTLAFWMASMPDGTQVYKLLPGGGFEVSTFDGLAGGWSNPNLEVPLGVGFHFFNPTSETLNLLFVGEVLQGELINPLPAGVSMKGSLVPQAGSINSLHNIPGEQGDELRFYVNDGLGNGAFESSFYVEGEGWVPDRTLAVGEGFYAVKQQAQNWVRFFSAF